MADDSSASSSFINLTEFNEAFAAKKDLAPSTKWADLAMNKIYKILKLDKKLSTYGICHLGKVQDDEGKVYKLFLPPSMVDELIELSLPDHIFYFICLGVDKSRINSYKKNKFQIVMVPEVGCMELTLVE